MPLLRCPQCFEICGDDPNAVATRDDGTALDEYPCFECICAELDGYPDDAA